MQDYSFIANAHPSFIDQLYQKYLQDPQSVEESWRTFFKGFDYGANGSANGAANGQHSATANGQAKTDAPDAPDTASIKKEMDVLSLIKGYRNRGHLDAKTNPIRERKDRKPFLHYKDFNLTDEDLDRQFLAAKEIGLENGTLREVIDQLQKIYCGAIGFEYHQIEDRERRRWLRQHIEDHHPDQQYKMDMPTKKRILKKLNEAVVFESFLHQKFIGQKRFSLEGGESTVAGLDALINAGARRDAKEFTIGMAHRGRLNVLVNIMGKTYQQVFGEFTESAVPDQSFGDGDVKYHLGYGSQVETTGGQTVDLKLMPNPSHLEAVDPVVEGFARAKLDLVYENNTDSVVPILIHGDAAVAGQGVVYETAQMSQLEAYHTGGTVHFVINNQVGFTTDFDDARSSTYCTGAANVIQAPVFHVNGDNPEAVVFACELAMAYRQTFHTDVFIDMVCYRRYGHNEGDDPSFTQPEMYAVINKHPNVRDLYSTQLIERGDVEKELAEEMQEDLNTRMQERMDEMKEQELPYEYQKPEKDWRKLEITRDPKDFREQPDTGIPRETVDEIVAHLMQYPDDLNPVSKINRVLKGKQKLLDQGQLDWAMGELLAYGSLLLDKHNVRMTGQDVRRGTFSHRHAVLNDDGTEREYNRLATIREDQGEFDIYNSLLSEYAVMGFEYGYALASPQNLVLWEGQFGDFYNGAQIMVDQFISAAESKWHRMNGLVLLLPHGYEGQGPEHSSARLERFLQQCAEYNMFVCSCTTPANFFHLMRRQLALPYRKPLIVMSPKSLLRHPRVVSDLDDFTTGNSFQTVIDDPKVGARSGKKIKRVLLCTGKVYFDLLDHQEEHVHKDVAIVRLEQLYPLPEAQLEPILKKYKGAELYWVQEEPSNMGAGQYITCRQFDRPVRLIARKASASPATGYKKLHKKEQQELVARAFGHQ